MRNQKTAIICLLLATLCVAAPWIAIWFIEGNQLETSPGLTNFLSIGGKRGRNVDLFFHCLPIVSAAGFAVYSIRSMTRRCWVLGLLVVPLSVVMWANGEAVKTAMASWGRPLFIDGNSASRIPIVLVYVLSSGLLAVCLKHNRDADSEAMAKREQQNGLERSKPAPRWGSK